MRVAGWGSDTNDKMARDSNFYGFRATVAVAQKVDVPVRRASQCKNLNDRHNDEIQLCAGGEKGNVITHQSKKRLSVKVNNIHTDEEGSFQTVTEPLREYFKTNIHLSVDKYWIQYLSTER